MTEIDRVLKQAAWRLFVIDLLSTLAVCLSVVLVGLIVVRVLHAFGVWPIGWVETFVGAGAAPVLGAVMWSLIRRSNRLGVARTLDERADLRESISTALCVEGSDDPWAQAVVETARDRARRVIVKDAIPVTSPRLMPLPLACAAALLIAWFSLPREFSFGNAAEEAKARQEQITAVKAEIKAKEEAIAEKLKQANIDLGMEEHPEGEQTAPQTPEEIQRAAMRRLTRMEDRLTELQKSEQANNLQAMKEKLEQLRQPGPGPLDEFSRALQRGDMAGAKQKLEELAEKLKNQDLSKDQKDQLKEQMQRLAGQLERLANDRERLEQALQQAGLSPEHAKQAAVDPEAVKKALENMKHLTEEQKKQLAEAAKSLNEACKNCTGLGQALSQMAQSLGEMGLSNEGIQGLEALAGQLSDLEMMQAEMDAINAALSECRSQLTALGKSLCEGGSGFGEGACEGIGEWAAGASDRFGGGTGGPGKGNSPSGPEEEAAPFTRHAEKSPANMGQGPIIAQRLVQGDQIRGEAMAEFTHVASIAGQAATEAIDNKLVGLEWHGPLKHYFGRLETRAKSPQPENAPVPDAGDAK